MSTFGRTFAMEKITAQVLEENPFFKDMLLDWRPAAYVTLTSAGLPDQETSGLRDYGGLAELHGSVANANKHVGKEKRFVDLIAARNPDTIDLEMALPAYRVSCMCRFL
jgi:hypothetical protein